MDGLDKIVLLLSDILEVYILYDFFKAFFPIRSRWQPWRRGLPLLAGFTAALYGVNSFHNAKLNIAALPLICLAFLFLCFEGSAPLRLAYLMLAYTLLSVPEMILAVLLGVTEKFIQNTSVTDLSGVFLQLMVTKFLTYILFLVAKQIPKGSKSHMSLRIFLLYLFVPLASFGIMVLNYYTSVDIETHLGLKLWMLIGHSLLILGNILIFYAFNRYVEKEAVNMQQTLVITKQQTDITHYKQIMDLNGKHREIIHNMNNYLKAIGQLAYEKRADSILEILKDLNVEMEKNELILYCENPVLNTILTEKRADAEKNQVQFDAYIEPGIRLDHINAVDLIAMLGNLLDNSIYAAKNSDRKVQTRMFRQNEGNFCVTKIVNSFQGEIRRDEAGLVSTKQDSGIHGIGVKSVKKTAEKYGGYLEYLAEEGVFTAVLVLPIYG
ncbi:MAG: GHKL domain-containing protein [Clostridium sp.]|nr:GHKL domain-containing protein [Clostridium sp.]